MSLSVSACQFYLNLLLHADLQVLGEMRSCASVNGCLLYFWKILSHNPR